MSEKKIVDYRTLTEITNQLLDKRVNVLLKEGFQPLGGGFVKDGSFCQTMVKTELSPDELPSPEGAAAALRHQSG